MGILLLILVVLIVWILVSCIKIVPQAKACLLYTSLRRTINNGN